MDLPVGMHVGHYTITGRIGEGGMGQVYRARDTRLDRDVALKVLPDVFANDADRLMRFTREAKTLAALNHPNIAAIHGIEEAPASQGSGPVRALVMELVEGEDLSALIARGALPIDDALDIARQVAEALEAAHEAGVIHRDLKPANIKVREDGTVKVLDFGLAKGMDRGYGGSGVSGAERAENTGLATMTSPAMTAMGMILGTAAYMSPEQARGKAVDRRADVWAFGVVFHEMLTGRRLFAKEEVSDTLAAVLTSNPDMAALPASTPASVRRLIGRCLARDKRQRLDSMTVVRLEIEEAKGAGASGTGGTTAATGTTGTTGTTGARWAVFAAVLVAGSAIGWFGSRLFTGGSAAAVGETTVISQIGAPREVMSAFHDGFALSPDGTTIAYAARNSSGLRQIWIQRLDGETAQPIPGTDLGLYPFWSPDSRTIAFFGGGKLRRVDADGARLQSLADVTGRNGTWSLQGEILFETGRGSLDVLMRIPADGGTLAPVDGVNGVRPVWLRDGRRFLYAGGVPNDDKQWGVRLASIDNRETRLVASLPADVDEFEYAAGILFINRNETLTAQRFDEDAATLIGTPVSFAPEAGTPKDWFALSSNGHRVVGLVGRPRPDDPGNPGDPMARLIWVDRQGATVGTLGDPGRYWTMRLGPDGRTAVVNPGPDLWLLRAEGRHSRFTTGGNPRQSLYAVWSPDGSEIAHVEGRNVTRRRVDQQGQPSTFEGLLSAPLDWSPDGRWLLTAGRATSTSTSTDLMLYDIQTKTTKPWLATDFTESSARFSPDGKWIAYSSNLGGRSDAYVLPFEGGGEPVPISLNGGSHPIWRRDGNELFYLEPGDDVMSVALVRSPNRIVPAKPVRLFRIPLNDITRGSWAPYDVAPDGQRFLLNVPDRPTPLFFLQGLQAKLK